MRKLLWLSLMLGTSLNLSFSQGHPNQGQIKPELKYASYLGGSGKEIITAVTTDSQGNLYVAGYTRSNDYPTTPGAYRERVKVNDCHWEGCVFATFLTKFSPDGKTILYSTYLGEGLSTSAAVDWAGSDSFRIRDIKANAEGEVYLVGEIAPAVSRFDPTPGAYQTKCQEWWALNVSGAHHTCGFIAKMNAQGSGRVYATFLGAAGSTRINRVVIDEQGNAYVTGHTSARNFPTTPAAFQDKPPATKRPADENAFVAKINPAGTGLVFSTYLGGTFDDRGQSVALSASGEIWVAGQTYSLDFPALSAPQPGLRGGLDVFISRLSADGSHLRYSTYMGGTGIDLPNAVASYGDDVYVGGSTASLDFPVTLRAFQGEAGVTAGTWVGFIARISGATGETLYSSFHISVFNLSVAENGTLHVLGSTATPNFPVKHAFQGEKAGEFWNDIFLSGFSNDGTLEYSTYLGGVERELVPKASHWAKGHFWVTGSKVAENATFPVTEDALQLEAAGGGDGFIAKVFAGTPSARRGRRLRVETDTPECVVGRCGKAAGRLRQR